jgi:hypothetical protein
MSDNEKSSNNVIPIRTNRFVEETTIRDTETGDYVEFKGGKISCYDSRGRLHAQMDMDSDISPLRKEIIDLMMKAGTEARG